MSYKNEILKQLLIIQIFELENEHTDDSTECEYKWAQPILVTRRQIRSTRNYEFQQRATFPINQRAGPSLVGKKWLQFHTIKRIAEPK